LLRHSVLLLIAALLTASASVSEIPCKKLRGATLSADQVALPTTGVTVTSARKHHLGSAAYCKILGRIHPIDPKADNTRNMER
jgi:hypothetical protein